MHSDYSGYWIGTITGTNQGSFTLLLSQQDGQVTGTAKFHEPAIGIYEYHVIGEASVPLTLNLSPGRRRGHIELGHVKVICSMDSRGELQGRWQSEIGTEGVFRAKREAHSDLVKELPENNSVFLVHGQDETTKLSVARFLEKLGVTPVILHEQINAGMSLIEKFEKYAARAGFAVVLMTPDDFGYPAGAEEQKRPRARQNVVLELGYFFAKLERRRTMVLLRGDVEIPSDVLGIVYERMSEDEGWKIKLARELKDAGFAVDMNSLL